MINDVAGIGQALPVHCFCSAASAPQGHTRTLPAMSSRGTGETLVSPLYTRNRPFSLLKPRLLSYIASYDAHSQDMTRPALTTSSTSSVWRILGVIAQDVGWTGSTLSWMLGELAPYCRWSWVKWRRPAAALPCPPRASHRRGRMLGGMALH